MDILWYSDMSVTVQMFDSCVLSSLNLSNFTAPGIYWEHFPLTLCTKQVYLVSFNATLFIGM